MIFHTWNVGSFQWFYCWWNTGCDGLQPRQKTQHKQNASFSLLFLYAALPTRPHDTPPPALSQIWCVVFPGDIQQHYSYNKTQNKTKTECESRANVWNIFTAKATVSPLSFSSPRQVSNPEEKTKSHSAHDNALPHWLWRRRTDRDVKGAFRCKTLRWIWRKKIYAHGSDACNGLMKGKKAPAVGEPQRKMPASE